MSFFAFALIFILLCVASVLTVLLTMLHGKYQLLQDKLEASLQETRLAKQQYSALEDRFRPVVNLDREILRLRAEIQTLSAERHSAAQQFASANQQLVVEHHAAIARRDQLLAELRQYEEHLEDLSFGLYEPHYQFDTAESFKTQLNSLRTAKKQMIRAERATIFQVAWTVGGSTKEGEKMQKQLAKLMLRAFNGESDAALANVTWNNITKMEERLRKSFDAINQLGTVVQVSIDPQYLEFSLDELRLSFEYAEKKRAEQEEQRRIKEQMREEERAQRELQRAQEEAAAEERRFMKALAKAREEAKAAQGEALTALNGEIAALQRQLAEAHTRFDRATSLAQLTRCGYVYVISNIGSFGEHVFKVGMTRRLDPMDRIWELGDASVPFDFDVHAMIYTEDAPTLEKKLHDFLETRRVNMVNPRKEFFETSLDEIEDYVRQLGLQIELTKLAEAREYRETLAIRAKADNATLSTSVALAPPANR